MHINNLKVFKERELEICVLTVIAKEEEAEECRKVLRVEQCAGFKVEEIDKVLTEFSDVLSDVPGKTDMVKMNIELEEGTSVISQMPYRLPTTEFLSYLTFFSDSYRELLTTVSLKISSLEQSSSTQAHTSNFLSYSAVNPLYIMSRGVRTLCPLTSSTL